MTIIALSLLGLATAIYILNPFGWWSVESK